MAKKKLTREQLAKIGIAAQMDEAMIKEAETTQDAFDAAMKAMIHTPPVSNEKLQKN